MESINFVESTNQIEKLLKEWVRLLNQVPLYKELYWFLKWIYLGYEKAYRIIKYMNSIGPEVVLKEIDFVNDIVVTRYKS